MFSSIAKEVCDDDSYYCLHHLSLSPTAAAAMVSEMTQLHQINNYAVYGADPPPAFRPGPRM